MTKNSDDEYIAAALKGNEQAFGMLMERYLPAVYTFALRLTGNGDDAEDIAQEALFKTWKHLKRFKRGASFKTWLFSIARNTAIDHARKKKPLLFTELTHPDANEDFEHGLEGDEPAADILFDKDADASVVAAALDTLPVLQREVLTLHYREELTLQEIATILKTPLNTVKSRDRRALQALKKALAPEKGLKSYYKEEK